MVRPADPLDGATPSGASLIAEALQLAAHLVAGDRAPRYAAAAEATLAGATRAAGRGAALGRALAGRRRGRGARSASRSPSPATRRRSELLAAARRLAPGGAIVVGGPVDSSELLIDRARVGGADAAYVCRGRVCDLPVTTVADLAAALGALRVACGT